MPAVVFLIILCILFSSDCSYLTECELKQYLEQYGFSAASHDTMVCIAKGESTLNTHAVNQQTKMYGLFQVSAQYWCTVPGISSSNSCGTSCQGLMDSIEKQVRCADLVAREQGLSAWEVYRNDASCANYKVDTNNCGTPGGGGDDDGGGTGGTGGGYIGCINCGTHTCHGVSNTNSHVCQGNGVCQSKDNCVCRPNYYGFICGLGGYTCGGFPPNSKAGCSYHGICHYQDECRCDIGWKGPKCEIEFPLECYGVDATDPYVCSAHGVCRDYDECLCQYDYNGAGDCSSSRYPKICYGYGEFDFAHACSGHGVCMDNNDCECQDGFYGDECEIAGVMKCGGYQYNDTLHVCSNHGQCEGMDQCKCETNYFGENCENKYMCGDKYIDDPYSCGYTHGMCINPGVCQCWSNWEGEFCDTFTWSCGYIKHTDPAVCGGEGVCTKPYNGNDPTVQGACLCQYGYHGPTCSDRILCGDPFHYFDDPNVCSGHGNCDLSWDCVCHPGYYGESCESYSGHPGKVCYGVNDNDPDVCGKHGTCADYDTCVCDNGYFGDTCDGIFQCGGCDVETWYCEYNDFDDPLVCSGHGRCERHRVWDDLGVCQCDAPYYGDNCDDVVHIMCFGYAQDNPAGCSHNGRCVAPDTCVCDFGLTGPRCESVVRCNDLPYYDPGVCSGDGVCDITTQSCNCLTHYYGDNCEEYNPPLLCYGIESTSAALVCSGRGSCVDEDVCVCSTPGYDGLRCEKKIDCNGKFFDETGVCSSHGVCDLSSKECVCTTFYTGYDCETYGNPNDITCFGIHQNNNDICSGNGACKSKDVCECNFGFTGAQCETEILCNGVSILSNSVCSSHGTCHLDTTCSCVADYSGSNCEVHTPNFHCFGVLSTDTDAVCSGHGICEDSDVCVCGENSIYFGSNCEKKKRCGDYFIDDTEHVCSSQGKCDPYLQKCICSSEYTGPNCDKPVFHCFGVQSTEIMNVCNGNGKCVSDDVCDCDFGYDGGECNTAIQCNSVSIFKPDLVCSGHGTCNTDGTCTHCFGGFSGSDCEEYNPIYCDGVLSTDSEVVCSSNGVCVNTDVCICNPPYYGKRCSSEMSVRSCFGTAYDEHPDKVCSGHGVCQDHDICRCDDGYSGSLCQIQKKVACFGVPSSSISEVCSGHGVCLSVDNCNCLEHYHGEQCDQINEEKCFGVHPDDISKVCSGNGICVSKDRCRCFSRFSGEECEVDTWSCFGVDKDDGTNTVCSGHGVCTERDICSCSPDFGDKKCSTKISGAQLSVDSQCFGIPSTDYGVVCSGNGICVSTDECQCYDEFTGDNCEELFICKNRDAYDKNVCSGHGECSEQDTCSCGVGFVGQDCESVYTGSSEVLGDETKKGSFFEEIQYYVFFGGGGGAISLLLLLMICCCCCLFLMVCCGLILCSGVVSCVLSCFCRSTKSRKNVDAQDELELNYSKFEDEEENGETLIDTSFAEKEVERLSEDEETGRNRMIIQKKRKPKRMAPPVPKEEKIFRKPKFGRHNNDWEARRNIRRGGPVQRNNMMNRQVLLPQQQRQQQEEERTRQPSAPPPLPRRVQLTGAPPLPRRVRNNAALPSRNLPRMRKVLPDLY